MARTVLWWGRSDPDYSRNRIMRQSLAELGWRIVDFSPVLSSLGDFEATLRRLPVPDLVWVPCFRQRDIKAARRWSTRQGIPLVIDPLISTWDKQVFERSKYMPDSAKAKSLRHWESRLFKSADLILADTPAHATFFASELGVATNKLHVVYVGAEQPLFSYAPPPQKTADEPLDILFFGSFIGLQGVETIVEAARLCANQNVRWRFLGDGPEREHCKNLAQGLTKVTFADWVPYTELPRHIHQADIVLGVFGASAKAGRVIPNKVFQAMACGRAIITRTAEAFPADLLTGDDAGITWVAAGDPTALANAVTVLSTRRELLANYSMQSRSVFENRFDSPHIRNQLKTALDALIA